MLMELFENNFSRMSLSLLTDWLGYASHFCSLILTSLALGFLICEKVFSEGSIFCEVFSSSENESMLCLLVVKFTNLARPCSGHLTYMNSWLQMAWYHDYRWYLWLQMASLMAQLVKSLPAMLETWVQALGWEDPLENRMVTHSRILAWRIPRTEEPGRLQS